MKPFENNVAVITGAAGGIGRALADRCAVEGMHLVLADIDENGLEGTARALESSAASVLTVTTDVSRAAQVEALADAAFARYGRVHLLFNNAGIGAVLDIVRPLWETPLSEWRRVLEVNLWGVIYGLHSFVPRMLAGGEPGHIVNTASLAGVATNAVMAAYMVSKHGVVSVTETLHHQLRQRRAPLHASVLIPGLVATPITAKTLEHHQRTFGDAGVGALNEAEAQAMRDFLAAMPSGLAPEQVAELVFAAIADKRFYIFTHEGIKAWVKTRCRSLLEDGAPTLVA